MLNHRLAAATATGEVVVAETALAEVEAGGMAAEVVVMVDTATDRSGKNASKTGTQNDVHYSSQSKPG